MAGISTIQRDLTIENGKDYIIQQAIAEDLTAHPKLLLHQSKHEALESTCHKFQKSYFYVILWVKNIFALVAASLLVSSQQRM